MTVQSATPFIVIGGGPVGLGAALLLAGAGHRVTVYEGKAEVRTSDANSYPLGVNARGQEAFRRIHPSLHAQLMETGARVEGWRIYAGQRRVAELASGTVVAITRGFLNRVLLEHAEANSSVTIHTGHSLTTVDFAAKQLVFETPSGEELTVDASAARVIAADGVWSHARKAMTEQIDGFVPQVGEWGLRFRVLFSQPGASAPGMDPYWHYIFGEKGVYSATLKDQVWTVSTTAITGTDDEKLLLSEEATPDNLRALRSYVKEYAPLAAPLLTDQDYVDFFSRGSFSGAVVRCPYVNVGEWLVLIGDSAHSVIPPTGEGVNSGLEDCCILVDHLTSGSATPFADYNAHRMPDLAALGEYAWTLMENVNTTDPARKVSTLVLRILGGIGQKVGIKGSQVEDKLFGPSADRTPYREIFAPWIAEQHRLYPKVYAVVHFGVSLADKLHLRRRR